MRKFMRRKNSHLKPLLRTASLCLLMLCSSIATAHPHNWIELKSEFRFNERNELVEITQHWTFDTFYSLITIADMMNTYGDETVGLKMLADEMATNLSDFDYFSSLEVNDSAVSFDRPEAELTIIGEDEDAILALEMRFSFDKPLVFVGANVAWSVYDPTYYISMNHSSVNDIALINTGAMECGKELVLPNPTDEQIEYASSLDRMQRNTEGLGELFAEVVNIQCI